MNERKVACPNCNAKLIVYECGNSVGTGNLTEEEAFCIKCGALVDSRLSQNPLKTRFAIEENEK